VEREAGGGSVTDPLFDLDGRVAVVTGGMGQLGRVYLEGLAERGMRVASFDVVAGDLPDGVRAYEVDVTDRSSIEHGLEAVAQELGTPHVLVNNAALDSPPDAPPEEVGPFEDYPEASFDEVMDVNVKGAFLCCQVVGGAMAREGRGSIVNVSSVYGLLSPVQDLYAFRRERGETFVKPVAYSVSKAAVLNLTRYLATYWASSGVRVNTLTLAGVWNDQPQEFLDAFAARSPMGRMLDAREALGAVVFLASDASSYVTGSNVVVDGGWSAW
jgi:NAD(P)-dependent dehydrogenase (short-subunit alcohol dehydrogenase family)